MAEQLRIRRIRQSDEFKAFIVHQWQKGEKIRQIAEMSEDKFGIDVSHKYISQTLTRLGERTPPPKRNFKRSPSMYDNELGILED